VAAILFANLLPLIWRMKTCKLAGLHPRFEGWRLASNYAIFRWVFNHMQRVLATLCGITDSMYFNSSYPNRTITHYFPNDSDHTVIACYLGLYKECEIKDINGVRLGFLELLLVSHRIWSTCATLHVRSICIKFAKLSQLWPFNSEPMYDIGHVEGDMLNFTFFI